MRRLLVEVAMIGLGAAALAQDGMTVRTNDYREVFVTVPLDGYANNLKAETFPAKAILVKNVPFDLVDKPGADNLFLKAADWSDWQADPGKYYAAYDDTPKEKTASRPILHIPVADYTAVWLLAAADNDPSLSPVVSLRIGSIRGRERTVYHDFSTVVPRAGEKKAVGVVATLPGKDGNLFLVRIPLGKAFAQDFKDQLQLDVDVTKELRLAVRRPDPARYNIRPLGLPSGVRIYGMTFERSPIQMEVTSGESGHIFNEPQTPTFRVTLRNPSSSMVNCMVLATATDYEGNVTTNSIPEVKIGSGRSRTVSVPLTPVRRGYHDLAVEVKVGKNVVLRRDTAFAVLPPDTRQFRDASPFGTWEFCGGHYTPDDPDVTGPLYVKAGLRYGMFSYPEDVRRKYGVIKGNDIKIVPGTKDIARYVEDQAILLRTNAMAAPVKCWMIFHETAISAAHVMRVPDVFTGREPYRFNQAEQKKFDDLWRVAEEGAKAIRKEFPGTEIYFGNGNIHLLEEFVRYGFPGELLGSRGNESMSNMRLPESQPLDFVANNPSLWMDRQVLDHYGYRDTPLRQCYEMCVVNTSPGNLSMRMQAAYYVRNIMHSLVWGIPIIRVGVIADVGNSYYFSNWGASGLCRAMPDVRPKPAYVAMATMTLLLDGATFTRVIPSASPTVYAAEFKRRDQQFVTCLWTVRGKRALTLGVPTAPAVTLTDLMGNVRPVAVSGTTAQVDVSAEPVFLTTVGPIGDITPAPAVMEGRPTDKSFLISSLGAFSDWTVEQEPSRELENYDMVSPRRKGDFAYREVAAFEGESKVLEIKPKLPVPGSVYLPMYSILKHQKGVEVPGEPTEIGLMVNGNGGWGRVIFELEDASGQRWISIGAEAKGEPSRWMADWMSPEELEKVSTSNMSDWNTDDAWGRSAINFEGWRYVRFPLPGNYPGEGYHWPYSSQWRHSGDGVVKYPLKFRKLIITLPENILRFKDYRPVARQEIYVKDLMVTYVPPERAFVAMEKDITR
jgi:hypothetical protein